MPKPQLYYTSLTNYGLEAVQKASFMSQPLNTTHLAVGDSLGSYYEPSGDMSALKGEKYRGEINRIYQDDKNPSLMIFEAIIPHTSGGYTIREAGPFDEDGQLFAIAKLAETVKPESNEGEAKKHLENGVDLTPKEKLEPQKNSSLKPKKKISFFTI